MFESLALVVIIIFKMDHVIYNVDQARELEEQVNSVCNICNILITLNSCKYS